MRTAPTLLFNGCFYHAYSLKEILTKYTRGFLMMIILVKARGKLLTSLFYFSYFQMLQRILTQSLKNIIQYYNNLSFSLLLRKIRGRKRCLKFKRGGFKEGSGKKETNSNNQRKKWIQPKWERKTTVAKGEGRGWTITFFRNGITGEATQDGSWLSPDVPRQQCHSPLGTRISL